MGKFYACSFSFLRKTQTDLGNKEFMLPDCITLCPRVREAVSFYVAYSQMPKNKNNLFKP